MNINRLNVWKFFGTIFVAFIGLYFSWYLFTAPPYDVSFTYEEISVLKKHDSLLVEFDVVIISKNGNLKQLSNNLVMAKIKIFNHGPRSLPKNDFEKPIVIIPTGNSYFVQNSIAGYSLGSKPNVLINDSKEMVIEPFTMKKGEYIEIDLLIAKDDAIYENQAPFSISTRILEINEIELYPGNPKSSISILFNPAIVVVTITALFIAMLSIIITAVFISHSLSKKYYMLKLKNYEKFKVEDDKVNLDSLFRDALTSPSAVGRLIGIAINSKDSSLRSKSVDILAHLVVAHYIPKSQVRKIINILIEVNNKTNDVELKRSIIMAIRMFKLDGYIIDKTQLKKTDDPIIKWVLKKCG